MPASQVPGVSVLRISYNNLNKYASAAEQSEAASRSALVQILRATSVGAAGGALLAGISRLPSPGARVAGPILPDGPTYVSMVREPSHKRRPAAWIQPSGIGQGRYQNWSEGPPKLPLTAMVPKLGASGATPGVFEGAANALWDNVAKPTGLAAASEAVPLTSPYSKPWFGPGMVAGVMAGGYGGARLVNWLADRRDKNRQTKDLSQAEHEYMSALDGLHGVGKMAAVDEARQKVAQAPAANPAYGHMFTLTDPYQTAANMGGGWLSTAGAAAALGAVPMAYMAYHHVRSAGKQRALQSALYQRQRRMQSQRPASVVLVNAGADAA